MIQLGQECFTLRTEIIGGLGVSGNQLLKQYLWIHHFLLVFNSAGEDAVEAVNYGVSGILVSNHGARQLDGVPATVSVYVCVSLCVYIVLSAFSLSTWMG